MMEESQASRIFAIPEILEIILLDLDAHTLLLSARVCRQWNALIKTSIRIQAALFFLPDRKATPDIRNPFAHHVWDGFFRKQLSTRRRPGDKTAKLPQIEPLRKEKAYLRPDASWRKMLLQQHPTSFIDVLGNGIGTPTELRWRSDGDYIRMEDLEMLMDSEALIATRRPFLFSTIPRFNADESRRARQEQT
ncbi:hypothetical protein BO71DRAFT_405280 [Aspergillus ellipticus CBS 707.79]|uniref:F-box domain-containing protein n=1 Tax=Aspergillus ellipticus CBS 707.79 TaxID=1448320 RepID=A0A319F3K3_9EURO|nr:hypothetical protein BO71DRAFT_405280 [Aspergillus ellipticus CBS 707.79]